MTRREVPRGIFVLGVFCHVEKDRDAVLWECEQRYGEIIHRSELFDFNETDYYEEEFGQQLQRRWYVFSNPFKLSRIVDRKRQMNQVEEQFSKNGNRQFNLDPGYVTGSKFVLTSRKNNSHRIYLRRGVYAEVTLQFRHGKWEELRWTFPDLSGEERHQWLYRAREHWLERCRQEDSGT